jgi:hypothetical protein
MYPSSHVAPSVSSQKTSVFQIRYCPSRKAEVGEPGRAEEALPSPRWKRQLQRAKHDEQKEQAQRRGAKQGDDHHREGS